MIKSFLFLAFLSSPTFANIIGSDAQSFAPVADGLDFMTVHSGRVLERGHLNFGFFINHAINTLPYYTVISGGTTQSRAHFNDSLTGTDFNMALGIAKNLSFGLSLPFIMNQQIKDGGRTGRYDKNGLAEIRPHLKWNMLRSKSEHSEHYLSAHLSTNINMIENNPYVGSGGGPSINVELIYSGKSEGWSWATNIGYRFRQRGTAIASSGITPIPDQAIGSLAISRYSESWNIKPILEIVGSTPMQSTESATDRDFSTLEGRLALKYDYHDQLAFNGGVGTELMHGTSTPDWRLFLGMNATFGPLFGKKKKSFIYDMRLNVKSKVRQIILSNVEFVYNQTQIYEDSLPVLQKVVAYLKQNAQLFRLIEVEGHTDSIGTEEYNSKLSLLRAQAIKNFLQLNCELPEHIFNAIGKGESEPLSSNDSYEGRKINRRVVIRMFEN
jgi:outer membrane protein OmpA-like peptidoglycan-associated protein